MHSQLVVLGAGPGGYAAAFLAADLGMQVTLIDQEARLGGVCLLRGCIPSKALLHVAKSMAEAQRLADWGVAFAAPQIDIGVMRARKEKVIATLTAGLKQVAAKRKVQVIRARAAFDDSQTLRLQVDLRRRKDNAPIAKVLGFGHRFGHVQQGLRGDAASQQTNAAQAGFEIDQGDLQP
jgi:pyruvate/2-oxoglutarate dehydrogenase complex dihydrolipoamide dehydrogenase (E3) component